MKKILTLILIFSMMIHTRIALAVNGDVAGYIYSTDILAYVNGKPIDEVISLLSGIKCRSNTSCPDQLATALSEYKARKAEQQ